MSVLVRFGNRKAFLRGGVWTSADIDLERTLNVTTRGWIAETGGPKLDDSDQELSVAREMAARLGGKQALHVPATSTKSKAVFVRQRQMEFNFTAFIPGNSRQRAR